MADFTALKTAIQTYIKQNGNEEITGEKLQEILLSVVTTLGDSAINDLVTALANEVAARQNADGTLQQNITNEATARGNADTALGGRIDDEATARANGDMALSNRLGSTITAENTAADQIGAEAEARAAADTALQELIDGITDNIENGYVYAGIATPSSTPATGKVFYLALTAGTYTNFGSTEVSQGINILKYNGSAWSLDTFIGIDDEPTPNSPNLVKSGGAFDSVMTNGSAFDISAHFASGGTLATYADLNAALTALNTLSASYKKGGMSIKFVLTSDNKYVQFRLMSDTFNTTPANWQGVDEEPIAGSGNLVESGGVEAAINGIKDIVGNDEQTLVITDFANVMWDASGGKVYPASSSYKGVLIRLNKGATYSWQNGIYSVVFSHVPKVNDTDGTSVSSGFTASTGQEYLLITVTAATSSFNCSVSSFGIVKEISEIESDITNIESNIDGIEEVIVDIDAEINGSETYQNVELISDKFFNTNPATVDSTYNETPGTLVGTYCAKIEVASGEEYKIYGYGPSNAVALFVLCNSNNVVLQRVVTDARTNGQVVSITSNGVLYVNLYNYNSSTDKVQKKVLQGGLKDDVVKLKDDVANLGDISSELNQCESNLFDKSINLFDGEVVVGWIINGVIDSSRVNYRTTKNMIPVEYGKTYYCSGENSAGSRRNVGRYLTEYDVDGNVISHTPYIDSAEHEITNSSVKYIRWCWNPTDFGYASADADMKIMIYPWSIDAEMIVSARDSGYYHYDVEYSQKGYFDYLPFLYKKKGETIVSFGDSITDFGFYPQFACKMIGAISYNMGFGGCRMAKYNLTNYDAFSMEALAEAIVAGDFTTQHAAATALSKDDWDAKITTLETIDFSKVKAITIAYGVNDFSGGEPISVVKTALGKIIQLLKTAYPALQIIVMPPMYRRYGDNNEYDSDTYQNTQGNTLVEMLEGIEEEAKNNHIEIFELYYTLGANQYSWEYYLQDGTHPTYDGYREIGKRLGGYLLTH